MQSLLREDPRSPHKRCRTGLLNRYVRAAHRSKHRSKHRASRLMFPMISTSTSTRRTPIRLRRKREFRLPCMRSPHRSPSEYRLRVRLPIRRRSERYLRRNSPRPLVRALQHRVPETKRPRGSTIRGSKSASEHRQSLLKNRYRTRRALQRVRSNASRLRSRSSKRSAR
jgi:hypothetical protein